VTSQVSRRAAIFGCATIASGAGLALSSTGGTQSVLAASPQSALTLYDFGARGDGRDESAALDKALTVAAAEQRVVSGTGDTFVIAKPVTVETRNHITRDWGFIGQGDVFLSKVKSDDSVIKIQAGRGKQNRALKLMNFSIHGRKAEGNGIVLMCPGGANFYNALICNVTVESVGGAGFWLEGNVFETALAYCQATNCGEEGMYLANGRGGFGGVLSAIQVTHPILAANRIGIAVRNKARDVIVDGGYIRNSRQYGAYLSNGNDRPWRNIGFENNYDAAPPSGRGTHAHVWANNNFRCCGLHFYDEGGGARFAIALPSPIGTSTIRDCERRTGGQAAGLGEFLYVDSSGHGAVVVDGCTGGDVVFERGFRGKWRITNSIFANFPHVEETYSNA
jgi:hypothetical protein